MRWSWCLLVSFAFCPVWAQNYEYMRPNAPLLRVIPGSSGSQVLPPPPLPQVKRVSAKKPISRRPRLALGKPKTGRSMNLDARTADANIPLLDEYEITALSKRMLDVPFDQYLNPTAALMAYGEAFSKTLMLRGQNLLPANETGVSVFEMILYPDYGGAVQVQGPIRLIQSGGTTLDTVALQAITTQIQTDLGSWPYSMKRRVRYRITVDAKDRNVNCALAEIIYGKT
jgi:hypothetical protein